MVDEDERTPTRLWSVETHLAELAALELGELPMPPGAVPVISKWLERAVKQALEPEQLENERLRSELARSEAHVARLRAMMRIGT